MGCLQMLLRDMQLHALCAPNANPTILAGHHNGSGQPVSALGAAGYSTSMLNHSVTCDTDGQ